MLAYPDESATDVPAVSLNRQNSTGLCVMAVLAVVPIPGKTVPARPLPASLEAEPSILKSPATVGL